MRIDPTNPARVILDRTDDIRRLELSPRAHNALRRHEIRTIGELTQRTEQELLQFNWFGVGCLAQVKTKLAELNLSLGMQAPPDPAPNPPPAPQTVTIQLAETDLRAILTAILTAGWFAADKLVSTSLSIERVVQFTHDIISRTREPHAGPY